MKNKFKLKKILLCAFALLVSLFSLSGCGNSKTYAVWWWDNTLSDEYLEFAVDFGIEEIYYCDSSFDESVKEFLNKCDKKGAKVYYLGGNYKWLTDQAKRQKLLEKLDDFVKFQNENKIKFYGVHLDIEPHQADEFEENRVGLIKSLIELAKELKEKYKTVRFEYDIPFWLHDEIEVDGVNKPAYAHMIDIADKVTVMSYRDSSEKILSVAKEEIEYAKSVNKSLNISVETGEQEDIVTFYQEGMNVLNAELKKVKEQLPNDFGIAIHHIKSLKNLKQ